MGIINKPIINPWLSMWIKPRATIQQIIDTNPNYLVLVLAALFGVSEYLFYDLIYDLLGDTKNILKAPEWQIEYVYSLIFAVIEGIAYLYIVGGLIYRLEKNFTGKVLSKDIRAAIAWAHVPIIIGLIFWLPMFGILVGIIADSESFLIIFTLINIPIQIILKIYTLILLVKCLRQIFNISIWGALLDIFLCSIIFEVLFNIILTLSLNFL